jgi:hypothetical protein
MKIRHCIYSIAALFVGILLAVVVGYTTGTPQRDVPKQQAATIQTTTVKAATSGTVEKNCGCCAERRERIQQLIRRSRERRQAKQRTVSTSTP